MKTLLIIITFILTNQLFGQVEKIKVKRDTTDTSKATLVGIWVNKNNKTKDNKECYTLTCKDTIQYLVNGTYIWRLCGIRETGKWKISAEGKIILYERLNKYWQDYLDTSDIGEMHITVVEFDKKHYVSLVSDEQLGSVRQYYYPLK